MNPTEETLTVLAYICYLLSLLGYCGHLLAQVSRQRLAVRAAGGGLEPALARAGTTTVTLSENHERPTNGGRAVDWPWAGRAGVGFLTLAWVFLTVAIALRWQSADHPPYVSLYDITTMLVW